MVEIWDIFIKMLDFDVVCGIGEWKVGILYNIYSFMDWMIILLIECVIINDWL